jgi:hypothetical protein
MSTMPAFESIAGVVDVLRIAGPSARRTADLLIEVPHGATDTADFSRLAEQLGSPLPDGLSDFFHVNTDAGAPELAVALAEHLVQHDPTKAVVVLRCRVPRTFIDCNRRLDATADELKAGKVTPGLMPWVTAEADRALLLDMARAYLSAVDAAAAEVMPAGGAMLLLHTYAPRTVGVEVDLNIVASLRDAYSAEKADSWPLRPEVDLIGTTVEGVSLTPPQVVATLRAGLASAGLKLGEGESYPLHPSTVAHGHVVRWPGRVLCVEVRRDLLADPFRPFMQQRISPAKLSRLAGPFADAARAWW